MEYFGNLYTKLRTCRNCNPKRLGARGLRVQGAKIADGGPEVVFADTTELRERQTLASSLTDRSVYPGFVFHFELNDAHNDRQSLQDV